jgi:hypothetical protein
MNKYFVSRRSTKGQYVINKTLASVRSAILQNKATKVMAADPEKWYSLLCEEFPDVKLRITKDAVYINEKE